MVEAKRSHLLNLPDEVIHSIVSYVPPHSALALNGTCRRLADITSEPLLWKGYCQRSFKWWNKRHDYSSKLKDSEFHDWKSLYCDRYRSTLITQAAIEEIVNGKNGRLDIIDRIFDVGYDAKDDLVDAFSNAAASPNHLAQRYWTHAALGILHRSRALEEWKSMGSGFREEHGIEYAVAGLDLFVLEGNRVGDMQDIFDRLNSYVASIRATYPDIDTKTSRERAILVAQHLLEQRWTGIHGDRHYHSLDHMFLGAALFSSNHNSIPLISSIIYCYVARHFNLIATPISYPMHVHVLVQPVPGLDLNDEPLQGPRLEGIDTRIHMYMDPFQTPEPISLQSLQNQLRFVAPGSTPGRTEYYLSPSNARDLLIRAAHNILSSDSHFSGPPIYPIRRAAAIYGSLFSLVLLSRQPAHPAQLHQHVAILAQHFLENFPLDVRIFESYILPLTTSLMDHETYRKLIVSLRYDDHMTRTTKLRSDEENQVVEYRVGQVFRHRRRGYLAVIYGWDSYCKMQEQWIVMNQVDRLSSGREQPFYNVLVEDESTRYVAQENVVLLKPDELTDDIPDRFPIEIGKWFKRFDPEKGVFVSNVEEEYPED